MPPDYCRYRAYATLTTPITIQISAITTAAPPLTWPDEIARMQHRRRGPDSHAHRAEGQHHGAEPHPPGHRLTTQPGPRRRGLVGRLAVQPGVHSPVDFLTDPLDETLGHGGVVAGSEIAVCRSRGPDFIGDAHGPHATDRRRGKHWG